MANHISAQKSIRKNAKRTLVNRSRKSRINTFIKKVEEAVLKGDKNAAIAAFKVAEPEIMKGIKSSVFKLNTASRKVSRLSAKVKALA